MICTETFAVDCMEFKEQRRFDNGLDYSIGHYQSIVWNKTIDSIQISSSNQLQISSVMIVQWINQHQTFKAVNWSCKISQLVCEEFIETLADLGTHIKAVMVLGFSIEP